MTNVIILHGKPDDFEYYDVTLPSPSNFHWIPWLQKQCMVNELPASTPEVFRVFDASFEDWKNEFQRYEVNSETILVGHSCGGGFLLRWLSENKEVRIKKLILVAPWLDPLKFMPTNYGHDLFEFERDRNLLSRIDNSIIFHSDNDMESIQLSLQEIQSVWPDFPIRIFRNYGHFCPGDGDMTTNAFPELLEEVLANL